MTRTQRLMIWVMRGLVLWGVFELGVTLYDEGARELAILAAGRGHAATMNALTRRTRLLRQAAVSAETTIEARRAGAGLLTPPPGLTPEQAINAVLRADLLARGAQTPDVTSAVTQISGALYGAEVKAEWSEAISASPGALMALAAKRPYLSIVRLDFKRDEAQPWVKTTADLHFNFEMPKASGK